MSEQIVTIDSHTYLATYDDQGNQIALEGRDPVPPKHIVLSKYAFRNLFTMAERMAIDNYQSNASLQPAQIQELTTLHLDFSIADSIDLSDPATIAGTQFLESCGLIAPGRATQILANQPATA